MLAAVAFAAACAAWHPQVVGWYPGTVMSAGEKPIDTWIELGADGMLRGRYVLHEPGRDVEGTLEAAGGTAGGDDGCEVAVFRWTDLYGTGLARLRFYPASRCFEGAWGVQTISPALEWRACVRERVTS